MSQASSCGAPAPEIDFLAQLKQQLQEWTRLPSVLCHLVSLFMPSFIYVMGPLKATTAYDRVAHIITYNPSNGAQQQVTTSPRDTDRFSFVIYHEQLFALLHCCYGPSRACELWSMALHPKSSWKLRCTFPIRADFQIAVFRDQIYMVGGDYFNRGKITYYKSVKCYNEQTGRWSCVPSLKTPRSRHALAVLEDELYAVGGFNYDGGLRQVESYNGRWCQRPDMLTPRKNHTAVALNGKLYVIGGLTGLAPLNTVECYDPLQKSWSFVAPLNIARWNHAATVHNGRIYVFGGNYDDNLSTPTVECYNESQNLWTLVPSLVNMEGNRQLNACTI